VATQVASFLLGFLLAAGARQAAAQSPAGRLIQAARAQLEAPNPDSAATLLERALEPGTGATTAEQTRAFVLYGIAQLMRGASGRPMFRQALQRDPALRIDSLYFFGDEIEREFGAERAALAPPVSAAPRTVLVATVDLPADTNLPASGGRLRISGGSSYAAKVVAVVTPADAPTVVLWTDTQRVNGAGLAWNLRRADGTLIEPGRYALRLHALDSIGQVSQPTERILQVTRLPVDTQAAPAPPTFAAESLRLRGTPTSLLLGVALGAAAVALPSAMGNPDLNSDLKADGTSYAVAGAVSLAGIVGFLAGHRVRSLPENIQRNREALGRYEQDRARIALLNARARENAPVHVHAEGPAR
jgi:hypothetical protein